MFYPPPTHRETVKHVSRIFTHVTDGAKINKLTNFVFHKVLVKHSEVNHLLGGGEGFKEVLTSSHFLSFLEEIRQEVKEAEQWLMYLQASNAQPQCGCQPIAQNQTVRGDVRLRGALQF